MKLSELVSDSELLASVGALTENAKAKKLGQGELAPKADSMFPLFMAMLEGMHPFAAAGARVALLAIDEGLRKKFGIDPDSGVEPKTLDPPAGTS